MAKNKLFVFDIETIPDVDVVKNLTGSQTTDIQKLREELEEYNKSVSNGNPFPRPPFHKVVAISFLEADIIRTNSKETYRIIDIRSGADENSSEEELIKGFFNYLSKIEPRFVSYNGHNFDLPVLKYRAMKYGVSAEWLCKKEDKWNNYDQKYSIDYHCDLLEAFSNFGASTKCKMNEICSIVGIPGKIGVDGSKVTTLYDENKIKEIRDYCETDVINTYLLYLNYQAFTGSITKDNFITHNKELIEYLKSFENKLHFKEFLNEWKKVDTRQLF